MTANEKQERAIIDRESLHRIVYGEIGRLLLHYQHIELMLKMTLPHFHATEELAIKSATNNVENLLDSKHTMGILVEKLKQSLTCSNPDNFSKYVEKVTANRNELVHKFATLSFGSLATESNCEEALAYLRAHHEFALPLRELLLANLRFLTDIDELSDHEFDGLIH